MSSKYWKHRQSLLCRQTSNAQQTESCSIESHLCIQPASLSLLSLITLATKSIADAPSGGCHRPSHQAAFYAGLPPTWGFPLGRGEDVMQPPVIAHVFVTAFHGGHSAAWVVLGLFGLADVCCARERVQAAMGEWGVCILRIEKSGEAGAELRLAHIPSCHAVGGIAVASNFSWKQWETTSNSKTERILLSPKFKGTNFSSRWVPQCHATYNGNGLKAVSAWSSINCHFTKHQVSQHISDEVYWEVKNPLVFEGKGIHNSFLLP